MKECELLQTCVKLLFALFLGSGCKKPILKDKGVDYLAPEITAGTEEFCYLSGSDKKKKKASFGGHVTTHSQGGSPLRALCGGSEICGDFSLQMQEESRWMDK